MESLLHIHSSDAIENWDSSTEQSLHNAAVVVLLVSQALLNSRGMMEQERPRIEAAVQKRKLPVVVVPVSHVMLPNWLSRYPLALDNGQTLDSLKKASLSTALAEIADKIAEAAGVSQPRRTKRIRIPDIDWVEIPGGPFIYQEGETRELPTFWIARYPVTNIQYQTFIEDGGYREERWWLGLTKSEPQESTWRQPNRPRTDIDWREAVAFSRWLSARLGLRENELRLPTEEEWEKAARGTDGRAYPWGPEYRTGYANVNEKADKTGPWNLEQTTAVGVYPHGRSPYGVADMSGTVLEWCPNQVDRPENISVVSNDDQILRGGSWVSATLNARAVDRRWVPRGARYSRVGFRLVSLVPISPAGR